MNTDSVEARLDRLERQNTVMRRALVVGAVMLIGLAAIPAVQGQQPGTPDVIRARTILVEDAAGQPRIVLGAPMPQSGNRVGLRINDDRGVERLGMSLQPNGSMVLGFDAPPGTGDDRNPERITIVADQNGGAHIRFLDRRTWTAARMYLDPENQVWMEFSDFTQNPSVRRRIGLNGEEIIRTPAPQ